MQGVPAQQSFKLEDCQAGEKEGASVQGVPAQQSFKLEERAALPDSLRGARRGLAQNKRSVNSNVRFHR